MRLYQLFLALCISWVIVHGLPNSHQHDDAADVYLELARELAEELLEEKAIQTADNPPNRDAEEVSLEHVRGIDSDSEMENEPPYLDTTGGYLQRAREIADQYMEEERNGEFEAGADIKTASGALRAFNRPSQRTQKMIEKSERENAEIEALLMLASGDDMLRQLHHIDLTAKAAVEDPTCKIKIDCKNRSNLNFIDDNEYRTIDGTCNNLKNYTFGMAGVQHRRLLPSAYHDGKWAIRIKSANSTGDRGRKLVKLPHARKVSNEVHRTSGHKGDNTENVALSLFYFMQFIDHDLAKTPEGVPKSKDCCKNDKGYCMPITMEETDDGFDEGYCMDARRSFTLFRCNDTSGFQGQINEVTSYLDASMIYGSSKEEEKKLRAFEGGRMQESVESFLPTRCGASKDLECRTEGEEKCYEAGDGRVNVHAGLATFHTLFVRHHNNIAKELATNVRPLWSDEKIYQVTRQIVGAQIQHIVYNEMLPLLLEDSEMKKFGVSNEYEYDESADASMTQAFSMAFRYHHLMPHHLHLGGITAKDEAEFIDNIPQENVYLRPKHLPEGNFNGIDSVALGMVLSPCPAVNSLTHNAARNLLFVDKNGHAFDLVALNIMRGRDWGMPAYTEYRILCGLRNATKFEHLNDTTDDEEVQKLKNAYKDVRDIDPWTGFVTERKQSGTISGKTQQCVLAKHFANLKHGDRFWYETLAEEKLKQIKKTTLARIMCTTLKTPTMRPNVFLTNSEWESCESILAGGKLDLSYF